MTKQANKEITRLAPKEGLPLQTLGLEFDAEFWKALLKANHKEFKKKVVDTIFTLICDIGLMHNDLALLLGDVVKNQNPFANSLPENRSCREYDHWAWTRAQQYLMVREFRRIRKEREDKEEGSKE